MLFGFFGMFQQEASQLLWIMSDAVGDRIAELPNRTFRFFRHLLGSPLVHLFSDNLLAARRIDSQLACRIKECLPYGAEKTSASESKPHGLSEIGFLFPGS